MTVSQAIQVALQHHQAGRLTDAETLYRQILAVQPGHAEVCLNLGIVLAQRGMLDEAVTLFQRALQLRPDSAEAHGNLGIVLVGLGRSDEAIAAYRNALRLRPEFPEALSNLGAALAEQGQLEEAALVYRQALQLRPEFVQARANLGNALCELGRTDEAVAELRAALQWNPGWAPAYYNLGNALRTRGELDEAIVTYQSVLRWQSGYVEAWSNLGSALRERGDLEDALAAYRRALALRPDLSAVHSNLIYTLYFHPGQDDRSIAEEHRRWNRQFGEVLSLEIPPHRPERDPERKLRIGYVSPDFCTQAESFFTVPLLEAHDHERFEIHCYSSVARPDAVTDRLCRSADFWHEVRRLSDHELAERIRSDGIDILVDLTMHMAGNRLLTFMRRPAPVQVTWLAYPGSTGLTTIDYRLTDRYLDSPTAETPFYTERSVHLADCWCCYHPLTGEVEVNSLPAIAAGYVTFGCLNHFHKINDETLGFFGRLLQEVEGSRLLMLAPAGSARSRALDQFRRHGIAENRVEFVGKVPRQDYLELYHRIDIALDTLPYNGITTTCDALWMGVPVVSLTGKTAAGRAGLGLLSMVRLDELVGSNPEEFVQVARRLAGDLPKLAELRSGLRTRMEASVLMDAPRFARQIEAAYRTMWRTWCTENPAP